VLVDFWASWCGPCRVAAREVERLAEEMAGRTLILKVDTEANPHLAIRFRIQSIPNFVAFQDGQPILRRTGVAPHFEMRQWLEHSTSSKQ